MTINILKNHYNSIVLNLVKVTIHKLKKRHNIEYHDLYIRGFKLNSIYFGCDIQ